MSKLKSCISQSKVAKAQGIHMESKNDVNKNNNPNLFIFFVALFLSVLAAIFHEKNRHEWMDELKKLDQSPTTTIVESHAQAQSNGTAPSGTATTEESLRGD